jgi:hypothetical protein
MFSTSEKSHAATAVLRPKPAGGAFFRKAGGDSFFGKADEGGSFFPPAVQPKLEVSQPEDPQEKEADAVADQVMRMSEPSPAAAPAAGKEEEKEKVSRKIYVSISRRAGPGGFAGPASEEDGGPGMKVQAKPLSDGRIAHVMRSARGPPGAQATSNAPSFEQSLSSTKGSGIPLPDDSRQFMESRIGADFSGVRVHTGSGAESLSSSINAQAFTHGNDIYFNSGKYSPHSAGGNLLLAHELTHTIQQGASPAKPHSAAAKSIQRKASGPAIQRQEAQGQRAAAVELAKAETGKVSANQTGPDGKRMGWERLLEYFKTAFGADRILPEGAESRPGCVGEGQIKVKSTIEGDLPGGDGVTLLHNQPRDAMPSWCGIFAFWALNKGGIPLKKWTPGAGMFTPESAYPPGHQPQSGDIAYRREFSHYALVISSDGSNVTSMNGNTAGEDHVGGEIQEQTHPREHWSGFFNPTLIMEGSLRDPGSADAPGAAPVRSLSDLRKELFNVQRKADGDPRAAQEKARVQAEDKEEKLQAKAETQLQPALPAVSAAPEAQHTLSRAAAPAAQPAPESAKEGEREKEEEKPTSSMVGFEIHRSRGEGKAVETGASAREEKRPDRNEPAASVQAKEALSAAASGIAHRQPLSLHDRGPPRSPPSMLLGRKLIQRSWLGDAWGAVSGFVGEAAQWVERGLDAAKEWLLRRVRDFVANIPGYRMLCLVLGEDPITGEAAPLTGASLLEAGLDILPLGNLFRVLMRRLGIFDDVARWLQGRLGDLGALAAGIGARFGDFWNRLSLNDVRNPEGVMNRVADLLRGTIQDIVGFVGNSASTFLDMLKRVMVREIAGFVRRRIPAIYPLLCVALGFNPETMEDVERNGTNILNALLEVSEAGREQRRQMLETGTFQRIVGWIDRDIAVFGAAYALLKQAIAGIWGFVTIENLFNPVDTFTRIWDRFSAPVGMVGRFLIDAAIEILKVIKVVLMARLSAFARETRGFSLVCVLIGKDPFTDAVVPRTMENIIKGFMGLMEGGEQQYEQLKESGAIDRIVAKVEAAVASLDMTPRAVVRLFIDLWNSFSIHDLARPIQTFQRIVATFGQPILRLVAFVIRIIMIVVEAILILMDFPFDLINNIIAKVIQAFEMIKRDPAGFIKNLLRAIKQGFIQFFDNIGTHLLNGVVGWLMSELRDAGVPVLTDFSLGGVISWVLQVLGISMEAIWRKLADHPRIGPQRVARIRSVINTLDGIWTFIRDVQERGMAAIWEKIQEQLSNLWNTVLDAAKNWIMERIINAVVTRLLSMLDPTGIMAVVNSAIAIFRSIQTFIRYLRQMLEVVNSFVEGVVEIAGGNITRAANFLEGAMDRAMPVVIGFLANQVGLGGIGARIAEIIGSVRALVDRALTWLVNRAVDTGMALLDRAMALGRSAVSAVTGWLGRLLGLEKRFQDESGAGHRLYFNPSGGEGVLMMNPQPAVRFLDWVNGIMIAPNAPARATKIRNKQSAVDKAREIDTEKARPAPDAAAEELKARNIARMLDELSGFTGPLFAGQQPDCSSVANGGLGFTGGLRAGKYGTSMTANTLTKIRMPTGTRPRLEDPSFNIINKRRNQGGSYYILGHLLNQNLGGTGTDPTNLTPLTREANSAHERIAEARVKTAVEAGNIVEYKVTAIYGRSTGTNADPEIQEIMNHEVDVPTSLLCEATTITPASMAASGAETRAPLVPAGTPIPNVIGQATADYDLIGVRRTRVYLNSGNAADIGGIQGVGSQLAVKIIAAYEDKVISTGTRFVSFDALADYRFSDSRTFTGNQKNTVRGLTALDYVRLYQN